MPAAPGAVWRPRNLIAIALLALAALATASADRASATVYGGISAVSPEPPATAPEAPPAAPHTPGGGPVSRAALVDGRAIAPLDAPAAVRKAIQAANRIRTKPYVWGGGHGRWWDSGYDCSGSVSYALHGAGLRWDTSGDTSGTGPRWHEDQANPSGFTVRHPPGY